MTEHILTFGDEAAALARIRAALADAKDGLAAVRADDLQWLLDQQLRWEEHSCQEYD